ATWYNLPESGRSEHLAWVHETYIPSLLKKPGYLWAAHYVAIRDIAELVDIVLHTDDASVPGGTEYLLMFGAEDTVVYGDPAPDEFHASLDPTSKKMLAMRSDERMNIFAEAGQFAGLSANDYKEGMTPAPCIQFGTYNIDYRKEVEILAWYAQSYGPTV